MAKLENWKLIQKYISGNALPEERRELQDWMNQDPENRRLVQQLEQIWTMTPEEEFEVDVQNAWEQFSRRRMNNGKSTIIGFPDHSYTERLVYIFRTAAVILLAAFTGFFVQAYLANSNTTEAAQFYVMQDLVTEKGEKARVTFSDGTRVILNAASSLRFPEKFDGSKREVVLDGEAYFDVAHNSDQPFVVHAQNARVQVLGTQFNIRGWNEDSSVDVAVREGKVAVNSATLQDDPGVILQKGEYTRVRKKMAPAAVKKVNVENYLLWTRGGLHFDNTPFEQVLRHLERKFDVNISVADTDILKVPFTSTFRKAQLNEILKVIAASMEMEYKRDGSEVAFQ